MSNMHNEFGNTLTKELEYIITDAQHLDLPIRVLEALKESLVILQKLPKNTIIIDPYISLYNGKLSDKYYNMARVSFNMAIDDAIELEHLINEL